MKKSINHFFNFFFYFSYCRECEQYASVLANPKKRTKTEAGGPALDFNSAEEKSAVAEIFDSAMQCLAEEDRNLPCIQSMRPMLQRGIGVHHSGLLPILKELVEILFQEQLIKVRNLREEICFID